MDLDPARTAVLALHWQRDIVSPDGKFAPTFSAMAEKTGVVARTAELLAAARAGGTPVVYTRVCYRPGYPDLLVTGPLTAALKAGGALIDGEAGAAILPEVAPQPGDVVVSNRAVSGFFASELDTVLKAQAITTLVLAGVATNFTVLSTAFDATNRGYRTVVASDCCSATDEAAHAAALDILRVIGEVADAAALIAVWS